MHAGVKVSFAPISLERRWNSLCAVTGCDISAMFRASHIKPWSEMS